MEFSKLCKKCLIPNSLADLHNHNKSKDNESNQCKDCSKLTNMQKGYICNQECKTCISLGHIRECKRHKYIKFKLNYVLQKTLDHEMTQDLKSLIKYFIEIE